jgi:hypothetical protein
MLIGGMILLAALIINAYAQRLRNETPAPYAAHGAAAQRRDLPFRHVDLGSEDAGSHRMRRLEERIDPYIAREILRLSLAG